MTATRGEDAAAAICQNTILVFWRDFNDLCHIRRELVGVTLVQMRDKFFSGIPESAGEVGCTNAPAVLVMDGGEGNVVEGQGHLHDEPSQVNSFALPEIDKAGSRKPLTYGRGRYHYPTPSLMLTSKYAQKRQENNLTGKKRDMLEALATYASGVSGLHERMRPEN